MPGNRRTTYAERLSLENLFGQKALVVPKVWWLQLCTSAPSDTASGGVPSIESNLRSRRRVTNTAGMWGFNLDGHRVNRWVIYSATAKETVTGIGWFEFWDAASGGNRWFHGVFIDPQTEMPTTVTANIGKRIRFNKGSLRIRED